MKLKSAIFLLIYASVVCGSIAYVRYLNTNSIDTSAIIRDQNRLNNIQNFYTLIQNFYDQNQRLPASSEIHSFFDPKSNQPYVYKITSDTTFQICATFETNHQSPSKVDKSKTDYLLPNNQNINYPQTSGYHCYDLRVYPSTIFKTPTVNSTNIVGHWPLSDQNSTSTFLDDSGNNHTGTSSKPLIPITRFTTLNAPSFDGTSRINLGNLPSSPQGTIAMWIEPLSNTQPSNAYYPSYGAGGFFGRQVNEISSSLIFSFKSPTDLTPMFLLGNRPNQDYQPLTAKTALKPNTWYHIAATWNITESRARIYINGIRSAETKNINPDPGNGEVDLGGIRADMNGRFIGALSDVYYFSYELTDQSIYSLAQPVANTSIRDVYP